MKLKLGYIQGWKIIDQESGSDDKQVGLHLTKNTLHPKRIGDKDTKTTHGTR